ncbi:MAG: type II toxin-antitoxin system RelE/ParE family toxin [Burkholderiales bacterium]
MLPAELRPLAEPEPHARPPDIRARFLRIAELLEPVGPQQVGLPHVRPLEATLWEMRMQGRDGISRAIYAALQGRRLRVLPARRTTRPLTAARLCHCSMAACMFQTRPAR